MCSQMNMEGMEVLGEKKPLRSFTLTPVRSSYALKSTSSFMVNFKINGRFNSSMLDDKIYSSLLHVIRKCVQMLSVSNIIQVVNPAEPAPTW